MIGPANQDQPSPGEVLDTKLLVQERVARELEARVKQLEMIAMAHGYAPLDGKTEVVRPDASQTS